MEWSGAALLCARNIEQEFLRQPTCVILAGGLGTRLRPVVHDRQKVMANVAGRPFLTYILDQLVHAGITRAVVCSGYLGDSLSNVLKDEYQGLQLVYSHESTPLGTAGALKQAQPLVENFPVLVCNGDSYVDVDIDRFMAFHASRHSLMTLVLAKKQCSGAFGLVEVENGVVKRFSEKESTGRPEWVNAGMYLVEKQIIDSIPESRAVSLEREILPEWVGQGIYGYAQPGELVDIGTPSSWSEAQDVFGGRALKPLIYSHS
ncbi:MAG: sugar phosphate nucleotidyltransferase [Nitrospirota bacterium]|nr:sugar phosphate nucleotidyltransferase [Nitrospirota bacterium]MDH5586118.1 sugar phosphate nucleotidyltransferase [Nitrospirota bacterium]MDH5774637.1 sugar phosphate nucleotidyltransferase [Nitrospirota bacterium]